MSGRHEPRLCRICQAPLACTGHRCWRCGTHRPPSAGRPPSLSALPGGVCAAGAHDQAIARALTGRPPLPSEARDDPERWLDEGARVATEAKPPALRLLR